MTKRQWQDGTAKAKIGTAKGNGKRQNCPDNEAELCGAQMHVEGS